MKRASTDSPVGTAPDFEHAKRAGNLAGMRCAVRATSRLVLAGALAAPALAQDAGAPLARSLWDILWAGMEWPAYLILAGSVALLTLILEHFITVRRPSVAPPEQVRLARQLIERRQFRECLERMRKSSTFFARVLTAALYHARHGFDAMHEAAIERSAQISGQMFRKVEYMNILGNLGPLMGLLGTVLGMILAFGELGQRGGEAGGDAGNLARGISLALVNTLLGLALAVIGLGFFGVCRNRVDSLTVQATVEVLDLLEYFRPLPAAATPAASESFGPAGLVAGVESVPRAASQAPPVRPTAR